MAEIIDAEFEMVGSQGEQTVGKDNVKGRPKAENPAPGHGHRAINAQLNVFSEPEKRAPQRMPAWQFALISIVACTGAFLVSGGYVAVSNKFAAPPVGAAQRDVAAPPATPAMSAPDGAGPVVVENGLRLDDTYFERRVSNGREFLSVEGTITNETDANTQVPALRLVFGGPRSTARYRIERGETLAPGEKLVFTSRIPLRDTDPINPKLGFAF